MKNNTYKKFPKRWSIDVIESAWEQNLGQLGIWYKETSKKV